MKMPLIKHKMKRLNNDVIEFTSFTRNQFKELNAAVAVSNKETVYSTFINFLQQIVVTPNLKVEDLPYWDAAMLFIHARTVSVSEVIELSYVCNNTVYDDSNASKQCGNKILTGALLNKTIFKDSDKFSNIIELDYGVFLKMRPPNLKEYLEIIYESDNINWDAEPLLVKFIQEVFNDTEIEDRTTNCNFEDDMLNILGNMSPNTYNKIIEWFEELPDISLFVNIHCNKCGNDDIDELVGLRDFFD